MIHNTTITDNYILITSDEEIKIGDYRTNIQRGYVKLVDKVDDVDYFNKRNDVFKKVIAHLPLGIIPIKGVPLLPTLPSGEDDVENMTYIELPNYFYSKMVCDQCNGNDSTDSCYCHHSSYKIVPQIINGVMQGDWIY